MESDMEKWIIPVAVAVLGVFLTALIGVIGWIVRSVCKLSTRLHDTRIADMKENHDRHIADMEKNHDRHIADMEKNHDRRIAEMEKNHDRRIAEMEKNHDRRIAEMRGDRDTHIAEMRVNHGNDFKKAMLEYIEGRYGSFLEMIEETAKNNQK